jgi:hypothetical protein
MRGWRAILSGALVFAGIWFPTSIHAAPTITSIVKCGSANKSIDNINTVLATLDPNQDNIVQVHGACKENVTITGFNRLTLTAENGASITDTSGGTAAVVSIMNSWSVTIQGFTIVGAPASAFTLPTTAGPNNNYPGDVIDCIDSNCTLADNTVRDGFDSIFVAAGRGTINSDVIQNAADCGIFITENGSASVNGVTVQGGVGGASGVSVTHSAFMRMEGSTVENNTGDGIDLSNNGSANIIQTTITGNGGVGVLVSRQSFMQSNSNSITGNAGAGAFIQDLSFAIFAPTTPLNVVTGNNAGGLQVDCEAQYPSTRGATTRIGGGTTNCPN